MNRLGFDSAGIDLLGILRLSRWGLVRMHLSSNRIASCDIHSELDRINVDYWFQQGPWRVHGVTRTGISWRFSPVGILCKSSSPFWLREFSFKISLRQHRNGDFRFGRSLLHAQNEIFSWPKVPCLNNGFVPGRFDYAGDPLRPIAVGSVVADG